MATKHFFAVCLDAHCIVVYSCLGVVFWPNKTVCNYGCVSVQRLDVTRDANLTQSKWFVSVRHIDD